MGDARPREPVLTSAGADLGLNEFAMHFDSGTDRHLRVLPTVQLPANNYCLSYGFY